MVTPELKEQSVVYTVQTYKIAHARACRLFNCSRQKKYYKHKMPEKDKQVLEAIKAVIGCSRKGRNKVIPMVQKKHKGIGSSRIRRVYTLYGYSLMKRMKKRIRNHNPNPAFVPLTPNTEWAIDFMHDSLVCGRPIRALNILDPFNRECKGIFIHHNIPASKLIEFLERAIESYGKPASIRTDNGPEFISKDFQLWLKENKITWTPIEAGKPQQNCHVERFNKTVREDLFDAYLFNSITQANELSDIFRYEYNHERPHESLNNQTPVEYAA